MADLKPTYEELLTETERLKKELEERKNLEKELEKSQILMQAAFDQSPVPMVVASYPDFTFKIINKATEHFLLVDAKNYLNKAPLEVDWTWQEFLPDGSKINDPSELPLPCALQGIQTNGKEMRIERKDGTSVWELASAAPIYDKSGNLIAGILTMVDITERKQTEQVLEKQRIQLKEQNEEYEALNEELRETNEQLIKARNKAEESDRLKTAFLHNMSHEIRTPLNAISGFAGLLDKPGLSDEKRKYFTNIIQNSSFQLASIVSDILTISALETGQEKPNIDKVCLNGIMLDLLSIFKQECSNKEISLTGKQGLSDKQSEIYTDKTKINQILSNLVSNALKFTHKGFIEFGYQLKSENGPFDKLTGAPVEIEFYVKDSGIGIKPEFHEKIFERFAQAEQTANDNYGGTGLGLAISKAFVELLGGKIWLDSEPGKGSAFYFTLPYKPVNEKESDKPVEHGIDLVSKPVILIAEDEEFNYLFIEELLSDLGFKLIHTKNGQETIDVVRANTDISMVLMDIKMPDIDGHTAAQIIKGLKPGLPIIAQSAYASESERLKYEPIFDDYLTKPIIGNLLIEKVNKHLNRG